jgi:hypothetical protein
MSRRERASEAVRAAIRAADCFEVPVIVYESPRGRFMHLPEHEPWPRGFRRLMTVRPRPEPVTA